ncbi:hypothetical protein F5X99DRAFT_389359 [Biscogniauxia marginata]|nr:hypothetical protein F5X99DRAFT_389359 [Biscogniauxia marginata]
MVAHPNRGPVAGGNYSDNSGGPAELAGDEPPPHPLQSHPIQSHPLSASSSSHAQQNVPAELHHESSVPSPLSPHSPHSNIQEASPQTPHPIGGPPPYSVSEEHFPPPPPGPPPKSQQDQHHYPPPPSGPPPSDQKQQYYPPPPPGPPPNQGAQVFISEDEPHDVPPPSYTDVDGSGAAFVDAKRPAIPRRPVSAQGQAASASSQAPSMFQPPPVSPTHAKPPSEKPNYHLHPQSATNTTSTATAASPAKQGGGFGQKLYQWGIKAGAPINKMANRLGSESFWPTTMDKECDKAARILKSFCKDGFYKAPSNLPPPPSGRKSPGPTSESKVLVQIPRAAIANAAGLAIFTTFRMGIHISGAGGSGIVMARLPDGSWSPPSGFLVHTLGAGFMAGLDIYDCVCVLNTRSAVDAFTRPRLSLGGEVSVVAGPIGTGASVDAALATRCGGGSKAEREKGKGKGKGSIEPIWSYMKSRGFYAGLQADGTIIMQRPDANAAFYGERGITVERILSGQVPANGGHSGSYSTQGRKNDDDIVMWPEGARQLIEVLKAAEGKGADANVMSQVSAQPTPGDLAGAPVSPREAQAQGEGYPTKGAEGKAYW